MIFLIVGAIDAYFREKEERQKHMGPKFQVGQRVSFVGEGIWGAGLQISEVSKLVIPITYPDGTTDSAIFYGYRLNGAPGFYPEVDIRA